MVQVIVIAANQADVGIGLWLGHAAIEPRRRTESNYRFLAARNARELLPVVGVDDSVSPFKPIEGNLSGARHVQKRGLKRPFLALCPGGEGSIDPS